MRRHRASRPGAGTARSTGGAGERISPPTIGSRLAETSPGYTLSRGRVLGMYAGLSIALLLSSVDQTVVSTVLPKIVSDFGGLAEYSWTFAAYVLTSTVTIPIYGKLGDAYGRRGLFVVALGIFVVSSGLCGLATTMPELIAFRGLQGIGAGALWPLTLATIGETVPLRERGRYNGLLGAGSASGAIAGPLVGGFIADNSSWRWAFFVNVPLGLVAIALVLAAMPASHRRTETSIDYVGAGLLAATLTCLLLGLQWVGQPSGRHSIGIACAFAAGVSIAVVFAWFERRAREPILPFRLVRRETVAACLLASGLATMAMYGVMSYVPLFVQTVIGSSATSSGAALMPLLVGDVVGSLVTGQWIARTGRMRPAVLAGPAVLTAGAVLLWRMTTATTSTEAGIDTFVAGLGLGLMMQIFSISVQNAVPRSEVGAATALTQCGRAIAAAFGVAIMGVIVNRHLPTGIAASMATGPGAHHLARSTRATLAHALAPAFLLTVVAAALVFVVALVGVRDVVLRRFVDEQPALE